MSDTQTRRRVLSTLTLAAAAGLIGGPRVIAAEPKLETTSVRLGKSGSICIAPEYVAEELLRAEGFTEIQYSDVEHGQASAFREVDFASFFASSAIISAGGEAPFTVLSGLHAGCFELFGNDVIRSIADLKGKRVGVPALGGSPWHAFLSVMAAQVGLDPAKDINGSRAPRPNPPNCSRTARSTRSSAFRRSRRICAPARSAMSLSTARWTGRGPSISAAC
jgi:NitT/TauT family transport system substrate-binding protein